MKWRILQKIFIIEDYVIDDATEHTYSTTHSTDYFTPIHNDFDFDASNDWELSLDYYQSNRGGGVGLNPVNQGNTIKYHIIYGQNQAQTAVYYGNSNGTESAKRHVENGILNTYMNLKFVKENGTITLYRNGSIYDSVSSSEHTIGSNGNMTIGLSEWISGSTIKIKNIQLKTL